MQVLALEVGLAGQPINRSKTFGIAIAAPSYNVQGRRYEVAEHIPFESSTTFTANLYIPGDWLDAYPGSAACTELHGSNNDGCGRATEFAIELAFDAGDGSAPTPTVTARAGFDNRDASKSNVGPAPFFYLQLDGAPTLDASWPDIERATPFGTVFGWKSNIDASIVPIDNLVRRDDWNQFSITVRRFNWDIFSVWYSRPDNCTEVVAVEW